MIHLLKEHEIPIEDEFIVKNNYTAPMLISNVFLKDPQKILEIPPVLSVSLWRTQHIDYHKRFSIVVNNNGQLCHGDTKNRSKPQKNIISVHLKTSAGNIIIISK